MTRHSNTISQVATLNEREDEKGQNPSNSVRQERVQDALKSEGRREQDTRCREEQ